MNSNKTFFGHPAGLSTLFATEMWERFSYYGMRALLVLFLTATFIDGGFGMSELDAFTVYGIFTGLVYVTPILGGILADKFLGQRKSVYIGAITMAIGQFLLAYAAWNNGNLDYRKLWFYCGLGVLILGNGFFKPNISTMVGNLYEKNDSRQDGGFTIFYMGINIGAFFSPLIAGKLGEQVAWEYGYLSAGIGMIIGALWFFFKSHNLGNIGISSNAPKSKIRLVVKDWIEILCYSLCLMFFVFAIIFSSSLLSENIKNAIIIILTIIGILYLVISITKGTKGKTEWSRVYVIFVLALFNIFFWSGYEQAGTTFNVFARDNTLREFGNFEIPASWFQSLNPIFIVVLAPLFSLLWNRLSKKNLNPSTPMKFAWGMLLLSLGFIVMAMGCDLSLEKGVVSPMWLFIVYLVNTCGELCLSPIGLSMVTKLSPPRLVSTMMGIWMGSFAAGNIVASQMKAISTWMEKTLDIQIQVFWFITAETLIAAFVLFAIAPWLKRMMKGIN